MNSRQMAISAALAVGMAAAPLSAARAELPSSLAWPFIGAGAILGTAALIVTAPVRAACWGCYDEPYPSLARFDAYLPYYTAPGPTAFRERPISYFAPAYPPASSAPIIQPPISYSAPPQSGYPPPYGAR
jgi:hypothetical protein